MKSNEYIFETSWEVCNKVGGIYTVLSTVAASLQAEYGNNLFYIGPDFHIENHPLFKEDPKLYADWVKSAAAEGLKLRVGTWNVPGNPQAILVDFHALEEKKGDFLYKLWAVYGVDSMNMGQDYENSILFSYAAGRIVESFGAFYKANMAKTVAHFHEWQTAAGLLYLKMNNLPYKTVFTTHATTVGRSICFNNKQLYQYFNNYNGDQMSYELGVKAQHAVEKNGAHQADCFTTVSDLTARECLQLLDKAPDVVTPNGFEAGFVPKGAKFDQTRNEARASLKKVAETLMGYQLADDAIFVGIGGRLEYRNKGIDVFIEAMRSLNQEINLKRQVVAFIMVPDWINGARKDLQEKLQNPKQKYQFADVTTTHELHQPQYDAVLQGINYFQLLNNENDKVKVFFVPSYLDGSDGIFNKVYYDLLIGLDLTVFPSYYEPWGYTPMESAAFSIPTITTDLTGFGLWVSKGVEPITNGVAVLHRDDNNRGELVEAIKNEIVNFSQLTDKQVANCRAKAKKIADNGAWNDFVVYYKQAFAFAKGEKFDAAKQEKKAPAKKAAAPAKKTTAKAASKTAKADEKPAKAKKDAKPAAAKKTTNSKKK
ncbi:MAG: glycogen/starch synthase [Paludibacteraceae bacterium]|nr:glycogen/starch synthase [Paludibacteraceae bacterium]